MSASLRIKAEINRKTNAAGRRFRLHFMCAEDMIADQIIVMPRFCKYAGHFAIIINVNKVKMMKTIIDQRQPEKERELRESGGAVRRRFGKRRNRN